MNIPRRNILLIAVVLLPLTAFMPLLIEQHDDKKNFRLQLLHFSDIDGNIDEILENVENFSALASGFRRQFPKNTLLLSSGDNYIAGELYYASKQDSMKSVLGVPGFWRGPIAFLNALGLQASSLGNHELDQGLKSFVEAVSREQQGQRVFPGAQFPYLGANIDFSSDRITSPLSTPSGQNVQDIRGRLTGSTFAFVDGEKIGIVGAVAPDFPNITDMGDMAVRPTEFNPKDDSSLDHLALIIQKEVDALTKTGINKILLLSHMQELSLERALAERLRDVDIIVAGGSSTLLADSNDRLKEGDVPLDNYPLVYKTSSSSQVEKTPVLVVNTSGDFRYLGRLVVDFDDLGRILPDSLDSSLNGVYLADTAEIETLNFNRIPKVTAVANALRTSLQIGSKVLGQSRVLLDGRREKIRTEETNLGNLVADAYLENARNRDASVDMALVGAGGIRSEIDAGDITWRDIRKTLPFDGSLSLVTVKARELVTILEHTVSRIGNPAGRFSQVSGLQLSFDPKKKGLSWLDTKNCNNSDNPVFGTVSRLQDLVVKSHKSADIILKKGLFQGDPERRFTLVTSSYLVGGGDFLPYLCLTSPSPRDLKLKQQEVFAGYLSKYFNNGVSFDILETNVSQDRRIQNLGFVQNFRYGQTNH